MTIFLFIETNFTNSTGYCSLEHIIPLILHQYNGIVLGLNKKCTVNDTAQLYIV